MSPPFCLAARRAPHRAQLKHSLVLITTCTLPVRRRSTSRAADASRCAHTRSKYDEHFCPAAESGSLSETDDAAADWLILQDGALILPGLLNTTRRLDGECSPRR